MHNAFKLIIGIPLAFIALSFSFFILWPYFTSIPEISSFIVRILSISNNYPPIGLAAYGVCNNYTYSVNTTSILGEFSIYNVSTTSVGESPYTKFASLQLNAPIVYKNDVLYLQMALLFSNSSFAFADNVIPVSGRFYLNGSGNTYMLLNINNCSSYAVNTSFVNSSVFYFDSSEQYNISPPFKGYLEIKLEENPLRIIMIGNVNNYSFSDFITTNISHAYILSTSSKIINVGFLSGMLYTPELVFGGSSCGSMAVFKSINATLSLKYLSNSTFQNFACYSPYGDNIAESSIGIYPEKCINGSVTFGNIPTNFNYIVCK